MYYLDDIVIINNTITEIVAIFLDLFKKQLTSKIRHADRELYFVII